MATARIPPSNPLSARAKLGELPHAELARIMLDESGYTAMLQADRSAESAGRLENLTELTRAMEEYDTLPAFLEHVSLVMDNDADKASAKVTIMTIHAAKGLEFDTALVVDPAAIVAAEPTRVVGLRRLYVVLTRAVSRLVVCEGEPVPELAPGSAAADG